MTNQNITFDEKKQNKLVENIQKLVGNNSIVEFCNEIGISREAYYNIINRVSFPRPETIYTIAKVHKIKVTDLFI